MREVLLRTCARTLVGLLALSFGVSGCGGGTKAAAPLPPGNVTGASGSGLTARIVGVGDSLTAGEQSEALLGATISPNPIAGSPFPIVPETQGNGYYALIWSQANGGADPLALATSPLPLMAPPGLGTILVPTSTNGLTSITTPCAGTNGAAFSRSTALTARLNPTATPLDVAIPGQTLHEALYQTQPTGTCTGAGLPTALAGLNAILNAENQTFYPILGTFPAGTTQVQAAVSLQPTLALVWLGSNDLLKYLFTNGAVGPTSAAAFQTDMLNVIASLQGAGAKVAVANLVDVLGTAQFTPVAALPAALGTSGVPSALQAPIASAVGTFLAGFNVGSGGYLTLTGSNKILTVVQGAIPAIEQGTPPATALAAGFAELQASATPFAVGDYVSDSVAANAAALNAAYNSAIAAAVSKRGAALVDVHATFVQAEQAPGELLPVTGKCCSLLYGGGFFSLDGLHPSNTAYAVVANLFIAAIDGTYGATIPTISASQLATINATDLYSPH
ncbi:MAG TPA: SGNH/GDSL hydrolase family protein [Candidatus Acidoferrales bacterium]|nr:SGNH/GDSL hydrolase family protein [Candidatus Acidoferrales bacterium]